MSDAPLRAGSIWGSDRGARRGDAGPAVRRRRARSRDQLRPLPRCVRACGRCASRAGGRRGNRRHVVAPDELRGLRPVRGADPAARGAEPGDSDLPQARVRLHHAPDEGRVADRAPRVPRLRLRRDGRGAARRAGARGADRGRRGSADRRAHGPAAASGRDLAGRGSGALDLLHVGHDGGPEGSAAHRSHAARARGGHGRPCLAIDERLEVSRSPFRPRTSAGSTWLCGLPAARRHADHDRGRGTPRRSIALLANVTAARTPARVPPSTRRIWPRSGARPDRAALPRTSCASRAVLPPSHPSSTTSSSPSSAGSGSSRATA